MSSDKKLERLLLKIGCFSRFCLFLLQILTNLLPDHDADAFNPPRPSNTSHPNGLVDSASHPVDTLVHDYLLNGFAKWDSLHFLQVAEFGYLFESDLAFFPVFPMVMRYFDFLLISPLLSAFLTTRTRLLLCAFLINNLAFVFAGVILYRLGRRLIACRLSSFFAAVFFYLNPASIFFAAAYSESLFFFAVVSGLLLFHRRRMFAAAFLFAFCGAIRSNGVIFVGFFWFSWINTVYKVYNNPIDSWLRKPFRLVRETACTSTLSGISLWFFVAYQKHAAGLFCQRVTASSDDAIVLIPKLPVHLRQMALDNDALIYGSYKIDRSDALSDFKLTPAEFPAWCSTGSQFSYSEIQNKYWDLGFLAYYRLKQIPNFLLAAPVIILFFICAKDHVLTNLSRASGMAWKEWILRTLIIDYGKEEDEEEWETKVKDEEKDKSASLLYSAECLPFYIYTSFLLLFGLCFMHVQVLTRLLFSSSPHLYFFVGSRFHSSSSSSSTSSDRNDSTNLVTAIETEGESFVAILSRIFSISRSNFQRMIIFYCVTYFVIGTVLHCCFLPWT